MTTGELKKLADMVAKKVYDLMRKEDEWMSAEETARMLGIALRTLYNRKDEIGYMKKGGKLYFSKNNINAYIEG